MKSAALEFARFSTALGVAVATVVIVTASVAPVGAETVREACTHDAFRLCSSAMPDIGRTKACLAQNRQSLSDTCKQAFGSARGIHHHHHHRHR